MEMQTEVYYTQPGMFPLEMDPCTIMEASFSFFFLSYFIMTNDPVVKSGGHRLV